jgi:hypothetical protein
MKLILYELKKLINKKVLYIVLALCFCINGFLMYSSQNTVENQTRLEHSDEYVSMIHKYSNLSLEDAKENIDDEFLAYKIATQINELSQLDDKDQIEQLSAELQKYSKSNPKVYKRALEISKTSDFKDMYGYQLAYKLQNQIDYLCSYPEFVGEIRERADSQSKMSSFSNKESCS